MSKYPIYVISKGRYDLKRHTADFLLKEGNKIQIAVEPQEAENYIKRFGKENVSILPFSNLGLGGIPARNWCWENSISNGHKRHWIMDDNIDGIVTWVNGKRKRCDSKIAFDQCEKFIDKFENLAIAGINYSSLVGFAAQKGLKPYFLNSRVFHV